MKIRFTLKLIKEAILFLFIVCIGVVYTQSGLLPPGVADGNPLTAQQHPLYKDINTFLENQKKPVLDFKPTGLTRSDYLKIIDKQVRALKQYQDSQGRIIDPVENREYQYATPCYAHAVSVLVASGYSPDLKESGLKALNHCIDLMGQGGSSSNFPDGHADFFTFPIMLAIEQFGKVVGDAQVNTWYNKLANMKPSSFYLYYNNTAIHNWRVIGAAGETLRYLANIKGADYNYYVETNIQQQIDRKNFTEFGMYRDDRFGDNIYGTPLSYDVMTRAIVTTVLQKGYNGKHREFLQKTMWKGSWLTLFTQSPFGEAPAGNRSTHHIWNEGALAAVSELYATAYNKAGRIKEAGAFKRAAHLALQSYGSWLRLDGSAYIVKNHFPMQNKFGYEVYSSHTQYNMWAASKLAVAWTFADSTITEKPAPADIGGFVIPVIDIFRKIFANAKGTYIEYDVMADKAYNSTGLIRVHPRNGHPQLGPSDGVKISSYDRSIGPAWFDGSWSYLATINSLPDSITILETDPYKTRFRVGYNLGNGKRINQIFTVQPEGVTVEDEVTGGSVTSMRANFPVMTFDGRDSTKISLTASQATVKLDNSSVRFTLLEPVNQTLKRDNTTRSNRNGYFNIAYGEFTGRKTKYKISGWPEPIVGCMDSTYKEYNPNATVHNQELCHSTNVNFYNHTSSENGIVLHPPKGNIIQFGLPKEGMYQIQLYNAMGKLVAQTPITRGKAGNNQCEISSSAISLGLYFIRIKFGSDDEIAKIVFVKKS